MRRTGFVLLILLGFAVANGFCSGNKQRIADLEKEKSALESRHSELQNRHNDLQEKYDQADFPRPLTDRYLRIINGNKTDPKDLHYFLSNPLAIDSRSQDEKALARDDRLIIDAGNPVFRDYISTRTEGHLRNQDGNRFDISFDGDTGQGYTVTFTKNSEYFEVASVQAAGARNTSFPFNPDWRDIHLCIKVHRDR